MSRGFQLAEIASVLRSAAATDAILVGGQALSYWCERYQSRVPELERKAPFVSEDADFQGSIRDVEILAQSLGHAKPRLNDDLHDALNVGAFEIRIGGEPFLLQCITAPLGLTLNEVREWALTVELEPSVDIRVMHPVHCMQSRIVNASSYLNRTTPRDLDRAQASVLCVREYIRERTAEGAIRPALKLINHVFRFALHDHHAKKAFTEHGIDCMEAVEPLTELPAEFRTTGYPKMLEQIERARANR